jgi:hypothetical protein
MREAKPKLVSTLDTTHKYTYIYIYIVSLQPHISRPELQKQKRSLAPKKFISMEFIEDG